MQGSIILKILIAVFAVALWQVISIPGKLWKEEAEMESQSRHNLNTLFEAQNYYYSKTKSYVSSDSLEKLLEFVKADSSLQEKQKIGELTHTLVSNINQILDVPIVKAIVPFSKGIGEISQDLDFNARYFVNHENLMTQKDALKTSLKRASSTVEYPNFAMAKTYVDSLTLLKETVSDYPLQNATLIAQRHIDSLMVYTPNIEVSSITQYWTEQVGALTNFINDIRATDITAVTSVDDRIEKFIGFGNDGMNALAQVNLQNSNQELTARNADLAKVHDDFINEHLFLTQRRGILQLSDLDSTLVKFSKDNFFSPDSFGGKDKRYLMLFEKDKPGIIVESPELLDAFQGELVEATTPIRDLPVYEKVSNLQSALDSVVQVMDQAKTQHRLSRYSTELLLNLKEVSAEMGDLSSVRFYRYVTEVKTFADTVQKQKGFSVLKPMIENVGNQFDTLAARCETKNIADLEKRLDYFGTKIQTLDSLIANNSKIPARSKRQIKPFYETYQELALGAASEIKSSLNAADSDKLRQVTNVLDGASNIVLNGYEEPVYGVFYKKHKNHGFIENGQKSWEQQ